MPSSTSHQQAKFVLEESFDLRTLECLPGAAVRAGIRLPGASCKLLEFLSVSEYKASTRKTLATYIINLKKNSCKYLGSFRFAVYNGNQSTDF